jgi:hypothetical protein
MTPLATNRKEKGLTSCRGCNRNFSTFTEKELETVRAAQKPLGALTIGGGVPGQGEVSES